MSSDAVPADGCDPCANGTVAFHPMEDPDNYYFQPPHTKAHTQETPAAILDYIAAGCKEKREETRVVKIDWDLVQLFRSHLRCGGDDSHVDQEGSSVARIPKSYLEEIYKRVDGICRASGTLNWAR